MYDLNKVMLIGRLTRDPEARTTTTGKKVTTISLAMTMSKNAETGEQRTEYIDVVAWEGLADIIEKYVTKGTLVYIEGSIQTRSWEGTDAKKNYKTEVLARDMKILTPKGSSTGEYNSAGHSNPTAAQSSSPANTASKAAPKSAPSDEYKTEELPDIDLDEIQTPF